MKTIRRFFILCGVLGSFGAGASGQWSPDPSENTPVCLAPNDQEFPDAVSDGEGGVIIAWSDKRSSSSNADIYAQRLDANGTPLWGDCGIPLCLAPGLQERVALAPDGAGGVVVFWVDRRTGDPDIYAQRVSHNGLPLWTPDGVPIIQAPGNQFEIVAMEDGSGGSIIAWRDLRNDAGDVYVQRVSGAGTVLWTPNGVPVCTAPGPQYDIAAIGDGSGGVFVTWADERTGDADVYVQRVSPSGVPLWSAGGIQAVALAEQQYRPAIVRDGADGVIVAWVDWRRTDTDVYIQRIGDSGTPLWLPNGIYVEAVTQNQFALISDGQGGAVVTTSRGDGISLKVYASRLRPDGSFAWTPSVSLISTASPLSLTVPLRMMRTADGAVVVWQDSRQPPGSDLYAQRIDSTGAPMWDSSGVPAATAPGFQSEQRLLPDGRGGVIVVFQDNRDGLDEDVYAQRLRPDGSLTLSTSIAVRDGWNLLSVPRQIGDVPVDSLFPGNSGKFMFDGEGYVSLDTAAPGVGLWVKLASDDLIEVEGPTLDSLSVNSPGGNGWVLVGALAVPVPATSLRSEPPGAVQAGPYRYTGTNYERTPTFMPGEAYWVFVNQACRLVLRSQ